MHLSIFFHVFKLSCGVRTEFCVPFAVVHFKLKKCCTIEVYDSIQIVHCAHYGTSRRAIVTNNPSSVHARSGCMRNDKERNNLPFLSWFVPHICRTTVDHFYYFFFHKPVRPHFRYFSRDTDLKSFLKLNDWFTCFFFEKLFETELLYLFWVKFIYFSFYINIFWRQISAV